MSTALTTFPIWLLDSVSSVRHALHTASNNFWRSSGEASSYLDFLLSEIDPLFSQKQTRAEIVRIVQETPQCKTFVLRPTRRWGGFEAGQYVNVGVSVAGKWLRRNYSLSLAPEQFASTGLISITVKQVEGGVVSNALCAQTKIGDTILISEALGSFTLKHDAIEHGLFVAAGSGITPIIAMLECLMLRYPKLQASVIYVVRNEEEVIFAKRLKQLALRSDRIRCRIHFTDTEGYLTLKNLREGFCQNSDFGIASQTVYLCGPEGFMTATKEHLLALGILESDIRQEHFCSPKLDRQANGNAEVLFEKSGKRVESTGEKTLLELAEQVGLQPKFGCRQGICHECTCERGTGALINLRTGQQIPEDQQFVQSCIAVPSGEVRLGHW